MPGGGEPSSDIRERVEAARERQTGRFADTLLFCNADMGPSEVRQVCVLDDTGRKLMQSAMTQMSLSARACHCFLKLARTIADLAAEENIQAADLAEALQYWPRV